MPFMRLNNLLYRIIQGLAQAYGHTLPKYMPSIIAKLPKAKPQRVLVRNIVKNLRSRPQNLLRPFSNFHYYQLRGREFESAANKRGLLSFKSTREKADVITRVKHIFGNDTRYNKALEDENMPSTISEYEFGRNIACGCNGAVYELRRKLIDDIGETERYYLDLNEKDPLKKFPLAIKMIFNYQYGRPEYVLWREMDSELLPLPSSKLPRGALFYGKYSRFHPVDKSHPNIIKMHTAFIDVVPILPDAKYLYPDVLPNSQDFGNLLSELKAPITLFVVMKRYRMTLRNYLLIQKILKYWTGHVMLGQLLEGIVFLQNNMISHRDMKSDNILLEFDSFEEVPHLVLSDFGSAAFFKRGWKIPFKDEYTELGGNLALRPPEIRRAIPGPNSFVNFQKADTWATATLAYEIFTKINPFYSQLSNESYKESDLPELSSKIHPVIRQLIIQMLRIEPDERPSPQVAANVVMISLFRFGKEIHSFFERLGPSFSFILTFKNSFNSLLKSVADRMEKKLDLLVQFYASETMLLKLISPRIVSNAELQLRATFLSRLNREEMWESLNYFSNSDISFTDDSCS